MAQNDRSQAETENSDFSSLSILLVDDHKASRLLLKSYLLRIGLGRIQEATDSIEAMRILVSNSNQSTTDAVFVSRLMRDMSGLELVGKIRELAGSENIPIVVISEVLNAGFLKDALTVGATESLVLPYQEDQLRDLLARLFSK